MSETIKIAGLEITLVDRTDNQVILIMPNEPSGGGGQQPPEPPKDLEELDLIDRLANKRNIDAEKEEDLEGQDDEPPEGGGGPQPESDINVNMKQDEKDKQPPQSGGSSGSSSESDDEEDDGGGEEGEETESEDDDSEGSESEDKKDSPKDSKKDSKSGKGGKSDKSEVTLNVGDVVKIRATGELGIISGIDDEGNFTVDEVKEVSESPLDVVKTGRSLGVFSKSEVIPYTPKQDSNDEDSDGEGEESDSGDSEDSSNSKSSGKGSSDKEEKEESEDSSGEGSGEEEDDEFGEDQERMKDQSGKGFDKDSEDEGESDSDGGAGEGDGEEQDEDADSDGDDAGSSDSDNDSDSSDDGDSGGQDGEDSEDGDQQDKGKEEDSLDSSNPSGDTEQDSKSDPSQSSSRQESDSSSPQDSGIDTEDYDMNDIPDDKKNDLFADLLKELGDNTSDTMKQEERREAKKLNDDGEPIKKEDWSDNDDARRNLKDTLNDAIINSQKQKEKDQAMGKPASNPDKKDEEVNKLLGDLGLGKITSMFNASDVNDWKKKLEKLMDIALGMDITFNPNRINKKVTDAPPGMEEDTPDIKNIAILLDCSGSMGYAKFIAVCKHLDALFKARKLNKTRFHLIPWGAPSYNIILKAYGVVVGSKAVLPRLSTMIVGSGQQSSLPQGITNSTDVTIPLQVMAEKIKNIDLILILTDGELNSSQGDRQIVDSYVRKHNKRLVWVLTPEGKNHLNDIKKVDPFFVKSGRYVIFKR